MAGKVAVRQPPAFEFMLFEGDVDHMRTVVATPDKASPWIDPTSLKLRHRIGRGTFGDVWLATYHQETEDSGEYLEVAIKMLNLVKEGDRKSVMDKLFDVVEKLKDVYPKSQVDVCWLHGISVINGKISIVMKFYEGSIGDKMARLKERKFPLPYVLRCGIDLALAIMELHSKQILVLNLKPSNFLLDENDQAILGDFGIPYLLGMSLSNSLMGFPLGTPNYMAPEQWEPQVRGPLSFETDSWGFGCSIVEMLTGERPWIGRLDSQIYDSVVVNQEKPQIPSGLPPEIENVLSGCFEYDLRNRPLMSDILQAFKSVQDAGLSEHVTYAFGTDSAKSTNGYTQWFLLKDRLQEGDTVRSRKAPNSCKLDTMVIPDGKVVGLDDDDFVLVRVHGIHDPLRVPSSTLERVTHGFAAGDWVRLKGEEKSHSLVGILHHIHRDGSVAVAFMGLETLWTGKFSDLQMAEGYCVGQFVRVKENVFNPRCEWPARGGGARATGRIMHVHPNGCLEVKFPGKLFFGEKSVFLADPAQVEKVSFSTCPGLIEKYHHLEDFHWAVRPLFVALGLFAAVKLGLRVGRTVGKPKSRKRRATVTPKDDHPVDGSGNSPWLPSSMTTIFKEGTGTASR